MTNVMKYSAKPTIYGTGLVALDVVISSNINKPDYQWAGGTCGNVLTILSYLGWISFPIARLNTESSSLRVKDDMKNWKVRLDFAEMAPTASVPVITQEISTDKTGAPVHKFHFRNCPKCGSWLPNYKPVTLQATKIVKNSVKLGNVFFFDRTSPGALDLARYFKELGIIIYFEPSAKSDPKHFKEAIKLSDIVKYSEQRFVSIISGNIEKHRPVLEIQTLGENGLRYRFKKRNSWVNLPEFEVEELVDTCGCGDWTTAGVICKLCGEGRKSLLNHSVETIKNALQYGQALGAWNCGFEGARGGMYRVDKSTFNKDIELILGKRTQIMRKTSKEVNARHVSNGFCPACPN